MNPPRPPHTDDDPAPAQPSTTEESDTAFGTRMQAAESEAERFGDPASRTTSPDRTPDGVATSSVLDGGDAATAPRTDADSETSPTEPPVDPVWEVRRPY